MGVRHDIKQEFIFPQQQENYIPRLRDFLDDVTDEKYFVTPADFEPGFIEFKGDHYTVKQATKKGFIECYPGDAINVAIPKSETRRGRQGKQIAQTFLTSKEQLIVLDDMRLRWITPREVGRLQGFDENYDISFLTDAEAYHIFGNAVTVNVAQAVAERIRTFLLSL